MIRYVCPHCGENAVVPLDITLDSGYILTCNYCRSESTIDIDKPEVRAERYKLAYDKPQDDGK